MDGVTARTWYRSVTPLAIVAVALSWTGCAKTPPALTPTAQASATVAVPESPSATDSPAASASASPTASATSASPSASATASATATSGPAVKATGSLKLFANASKKLTGSCPNKAGAPTLTVADKKNDFFQTVDVTLVLTAGKKSVASITIDLGEDSELITRKLTYNAGQPASGTSAKLAVRGATYTVAGTLASAENGSPAGTMPVILTVACAGTSW